MTAPTTDRAPCPPRHFSPRLEARLKRLRSSTFRKALKLLRRLLVALFVVVLAATPALAAPGALDTTYSGDGITQNTFGTGDHVVVDSQGRVLVGGQVLPARLDAGRPSIMRYKANGALDPTLDGDGRMSLPVQGRVRGIALQGGNILVATESSLWRLKPSGATDPTFGSNGRIDFPDSGTVGGRHPLWATGTRAYVILDVPGSVSSSVYVFTADGGRSGAASPYGVRLESIALHEGRVYAVGATKDRYQGGRVVVARFNTMPSMALDAGFNGGRELAYGPALIYDQFGPVTQFTPMDIAVNVTTDKFTVVGDKYECSGDSCSTYTYGFAIRFDPSSALDGTFGGDGEAMAGCTNGGDGMTSVMLQGNKTIVAGESWTEDDPEQRFGVARLTASGARDITFSRAPCDTTYGTEGAIVQDAVLAGGKVIAVGGVYTARYLAT